MDDTKNTVKNNWKALGVILLSPEILLLMLVNLALITVTFFTHQKMESYILTLIIAVIALVSVALGSFTTQRRFDLYQKDQLRARGYQAIRGMNLLLSHIFSLKKRVNVSMRRLNREEYSYELMRAYFEEIIESCNNLFEDIVNSIENWQDLIPEANLRTQVAAVNQLKNEIYQRINDLKELRKLSEKIDKDMSIDDQGRIKMTIQQLEMTLTKLESELKNEESKVLIDSQLYSYQEGKLVFSENYDSDLIQENLRNFKPKNFLTKKEKIDIKLP